MAYKLLLADDSITIQKVVELILPEDEFTIVSVSNGQEAWERLEADLPDIILADIEMPEMDGYELCRKVKGDSRTAGIPVILLAGAFESFDTARAKEAGAADHVIKPFESSELIGKISAVLGGEVPEGTVEAIDAGVEAEVEEDLPILEFDEEDAVEAEIEDESMISVEPVGEVEVPSAEDDDLWGAEEIPEVGEESHEWGDALGGTVEIEPAGGPAEALEEESSLELAAEAIDVHSFVGESEEVVAVAEEETAPGEDAGTEEMELAEDAEAVEEEFAEQILVQEAGESHATPLQVSIGEADVREAIRAAVAAAMPSAEDLGSLVRETVAGAITIPDLGEILSGAAKDAVPDSSALRDSFRDAVDSQDLAGIVRGVVEDEVKGSLQELLRKTIESILWEVLPETAERVTRQIVEEHAPASLRNIFEKVAWETVPDVAERIISAEIERIKAQ